MLNGNTLFLMINTMYVTVVIYACGFDSDFDFKIFNFVFYLRYKDFALKNIYILCMYELYDSLFDRHILTVCGLALTLIT